MPFLLLLAFIIVPLVELFVIQQVATGIGLLPTLVLLLAVSVAGAWLVKQQGRAAWRKLRRAFGEARIPTVEVVDGALVLIGGTLLLTPGFVTDAVGLLLVVPPTRAVANRYVRRRVRSAVGFPGQPRQVRRRPGDDTIDVEVVSVERTRADDEPPATGT